MTITPPASPTTRPARPSAVTAGVALWLGAILAGVAEAFVHLAMPDPPSGGDLVVRFGIYAVLAVLVLSLRSGSNLARWAVVVLLGGVGTLSLVIEPIRWMAEGGSPAVYLATAGLPDLAAAGLRTLHVLEVLAALMLLFHPSARRFFRGTRVTAAPDQAAGATIR